MSRAEGHQEQIERLIIRSLDNALSADEKLELDRELIRDPAARLMMDEYRSIDELAGAALEGVVEGGEVAADSIAADQQRRPVAAAKRSRRFNSGWLLIPGAIAAAILAIVIPRANLTELENPVASAPNLQSASHLTPALGVGGANPQDVMRPVASVPSIRRRTGRELIGVVGDDGNLYWIEVERTRTIRLPRSRPVSSSALNEL